MAGLPAEWTNFALGVLVVLGTWLATWLARKGKREDTKIAETNQAFTHMQNLAEERLAEIQQLRAESERLHRYWQARWNRQAKRCRQVTDPLLQSITALRKIAGPAAEAQAADVSRVLEEHRQDDHDDHGTPT